MLKINRKMGQDVKIVNKELPEGFHEFWDNFDQEAYEKYLDEKEKWRIEKMKKEN